MKLFLALVSSSAWWRVFCSCCTVTDDQCDSTSCFPVQVWLCVSVFTQYLSTLPHLYHFSLFFPLHHFLLSQFLYYRLLFKLFSFLYQDLRSLPSSVSFSSLCLHSSLPPRLLFWFCSFSPSLVPSPLPLPYFSFLSSSIFPSLFSNSYLLPPPYLLVSFLFSSSILLLTYPCVSSHHTLLSLLSLSFLPPSPPPPLGLVLSTLSFSQRSTLWPSSPPLWCNFLCNDTLFSSISSHGDSVDSDDDDVCDLLLWRPPPPLCLFSVKFQ